MTLLQYNHGAIDLVQRDAEEVRERFRPWQGRYQEWMRFAFPAMARTGSVMRLGSVFQTEAIREVEEKRSHYVTEWVGSRGETLTNRRHASKTNILPELYSDERDDVAGEKLIHLGLSIFDSLDSQLWEGMGGVSWDYNMKQMLTWTGKVAFQVRVHETAPGVVGVEAALIDPYNLYHDIGTFKGERHRVVRDFPVRWSDVPALVGQYGGEYGLQPQKPPDKADTDYVVATDYWCRWPDGSIRHSMLVDGKPVRLDGSWVDHGYPHIPIVVVSRPGASHHFEQARAAALDIRDSRIYYHAEPFYARAINLLTFLQGLESLAADGAALASLPIFLHRLKSGEEGIQKSDIRPLALLELSDEEQLEILKGINQGQITLDSALQRVKGELNDIYPDFLVGMSGVAQVSGFSFNSQLINQAKTFMVPWTRADEAAKQQLLMMVFAQHRAVFPNHEFHMSGVLPEGARRTFKLSDYPKGDFSVDVQEPAEIPGEALQALQTAMQSNQAGLVSKRTARITQLGMNQPDQEQERLDQEDFRQSMEYRNADHLVRMGKWIDELRQAVKLHKVGTAARSAANIALAEAEGMLKAARMALTGAPQTGAPQTGFTMPQQPGLPAPAQLPPEMIPGQNPDVNALAQGRPSGPAVGRPRPAGVS